MRVLGEIARYIYCYPPYIFGWFTRVLGGFYRGPRQEEWNLLQLLSGAVHRHYICGDNKEADAILFLQFDRAVRLDRQHGSVGLHTAAGLGREALVGQVYYILHYFTLNYYSQSAGNVIYTVVCSLHLQSSCIKKEEGQSGITKKGSSVIYPI